MINTLYRRAVAYLAALIVPDVERVLGGFNALEAKLNRAIDRAQTQIDAEFGLIDASFARQQRVVASERTARAASSERINAAISAQSRASRVRNRVRDLLA